MKLKNKKTGEIGYPYFQNWKEITCVIVDENAIQIAEYKSLAELNAEWEDYKEPKEFWYLDSDGEILSDTSDDKCEFDMNCKQIGNYFDTKEKAEKAVEKLKAWKRLKDYNVSFNLDFVKNKIDFTYSINNSLLDVLDGEEQIFNNLKIVFGGEE